MDKYEKVKEIGEGSFGKAILVKSKEDGHQYVIKEIGISRMSSKERQESRKEVAVLANMSHPNIVQYKESFEEEGCLYIVMDYCEGGDLFKKINSQKGVLFPEEQILNWFVQICLALKHVHDRKILHRDIKSQNIFLTKDGTIQLGDFGIARVLNSTVELARTCIGTPYYLSPEICENKPYNNKSDIWALGCVLYEMCTLKHAFEAGNMKNLVLKIIRGSYPPVSVHYSQELRYLLGQLFKRNPRERPSVSNILDKPFLFRRIQLFLPPQIIAQEFSHTFLHKQPKIGVAQGPPARRPAPAGIPHTPAQKITKPAAKYGVPLTIKKVSDAAKKPVERRPALKNKPAPLPAAPQRRLSQVEEERKKSEDGNRKKRMELTKKERKQGEQMLLLKAGQVKRYEKEKMNRINQAREQGWKHVLSSSGGSSPERKCYRGGGKRGAGAGPIPTPRAGSTLGPVPGPAAAPIPALAPSRGLYERYHAALDQMAKPQPKEVGRVGALAESDICIQGVPAATGPILPNGSARFPHHDEAKREPHRLQYIPKQAHISRQRHMGAERAYQVEEFLQRKREAMLNKVRAEGQLGARQNLAAIYGSRAGSVRCRRPKANKEEEEYLARLRQIRLQNFNERQQIKARLRGEKYDSDGSDSQESSEEAELRRKKIEALKARAAVLKEQLEKKRREAYEREKRAWEDHLVAQGVKVGAAAVDSPSETSLPQPGPPQPEPAAKALVLPASKPSTPAISMTAALKDVGANSPIKEDPLKPETATVIQSEKKQILHRLNKNLKTQSPVEEEYVTTTLSLDPVPEQNQPIIEERPASGGDRKKWVPAEPPVLSAAQQTLEGTCLTTVGTPVPAEERPSSGGERKKWEAGVPIVLSIAQQTLEETCIRTAEHTVGEVIQVGLLQGEAPRKAWGRSPDSQVLRVLQEAELQPLTQVLQKVSISEDKSNQSAVLEDARTPKVVISPTLSPQVAVQGADVKGHEEVTTVTVIPDQERPVAGAKEKGKISPDFTEIKDPADLESVVLEQYPKKGLQHPAEVQQAWEEQVQWPPPPEGGVRPAETEVQKHTDKQTESSGLPPCEEPLFIKLCSPAHRRAAALSVLSAQSSMDESSSSLASRSRSVSPLRSKHQDALLIGLSTGMFDTSNPKMLRTCSLPDLSRVFSSQQDPAMSNGAVVAPDNNLEIEDLEETAKDEDQSETEDGYEDEDLRELRASMERLLQEEGDFSGSPPEGEPGDFNGNPTRDDNKVPHNRIAAEAEEDDLHQMAVDDDEDEEEEEEEEGSNGSPADEELLSNGVEEEHHSSDSQLNEEWHSDGSGEEQGGEVEHQDSIFSRLEELRFNLEQQMGFENFIEAYNKIKAIHEDEDENIELGSSLVLSILGTENQHLYPNILHLVMADGVYQEDNDE
ncbi:serine/threonine-protein kinase Nek1 [Lampris incognitus]|uniref:serine/threonine-protein kinase Nek1 n=1 Tax=Lampris incognitus TaxID=2546036 RepID=UPI0024B5CB80|nr:serine/threonine-protein kinase Nek1 [Lampris incognitus]